MVVYTAHEPPTADDSPQQRAISITFIKDGFSFLAALVPPIWLLAHGLILITLAYLAIAMGLAIGLEALGVAGNWIGWAIIALNVLLGFEAADLRRWHLRRKGWRELGSVTGISRLDCERRFFDAWLPAQSQNEPGPPLQDRLPAHAQ